MSLPLIKNPIGFALNQTFIKPVTARLAWQARQFTPKQIGYNMLSSNKLGQTALTFAYNLKFAKDPISQDPSTAGFTNKAFEQHMRNGTLANPPI